MIGNKARLYEALGEDVVRCLVCERRCIIKEGERGICKNYINRMGDLYHLGYGVLSAIESRPIEIKPLFHYWPNSTALTFSGYGCNFYCPWCQNNHLSFSDLPKHPKQLSPNSLVERALKLGDEGLCASFNEPATLYDFLLDLFDLGSGKGLYGVLVTNGYLTEKALKELVEAGADGFSIDIKGCPYARSALTTIDHEKVIKSSRYLIDLGAHVEMIYLMVTGFNDSEECIEWILEKHLEILGPETPLHINRYYPAHNWREPPTSLPKLLKAREMAKKIGIEYVYVGNVGISELEATRCPKCGKMLIERHRYRVTYFRLEDNRCPRCGKRIPIRGRYVAEKFSQIM